MPPLMKLPEYDYPRNALINFAPINDAIDGNRQNALMQRKADNEDARLGMERERLGMEKTKFGDSQQQQVRDRAGNLALLALQEPDDSRRTQKWQTFIATHPNAAKLDPSYHDPNTGPLKILGEAGMAQQYLDYQMKRTAERRASAQLDLARNQDARAAATHTANMAQYENMSPASRAEAAPSLGLKQGTAEQTMFISSGKYTRPDEAKKLNIVPEGALLVATDPRTGQHETVVTGAPKDLKDFQTKDAMWGERMTRSERNIDEIAGIDKVTGAPAPNAYNPARTLNRFAPDSPSLSNLYTANLFNSKNWQRYQQAAREGIAAILRKDTGAAVTQGEWDLYFPMYYPQPGDDPRVVLQKKEAREAASHALRASSGPAYDRMFPGKPKDPSADPLGIR